MAYRIYLIHWKKEEVEARAAYLIQAGYSVVSDMPAGRDFLAGLAKRRNFTPGRYTAGSKTRPCPMSIRYFMV